MSYLAAGLGEEKFFKPLVTFSDKQDRASLVSSKTKRRNMPAKRRRSVGRKRRVKSRGRSTGRRRTRRSTKASRTKVRIIKGRVSIRVAGFPGYQRIGASQLVRHVPLSKLRVAAKRVLGGRGRGSGTRKRRSGSKHRRRASSIIL
jgi:hypothetical protein